MVMRRLGMTHDEADDFDHPRLEPDHRLSRHVLYRARRSEFGEFSQEGAGTIVR
jgi:hypothetical protein